MVRHGNELTYQEVYDSGRLELGCRHRRGSRSVVVVVGGGDWRYYEILRGGGYCRSVESALSRAKLQALRCRNALSIFMIFLSIYSFPFPPFL
jgi:hypothetical protein